MKWMRHSRFSVQDDGSLPMSRSYATRTHAPRRSRQHHAGVPRHIGNQNLTDAQLHRIQQFDGPQFNGCIHAYPRRADRRTAPHQSGLGHDRGFMRQTSRTPCVIHGDSHVSRHAGHAPDQATSPRLEDVRLFRRRAPGSWHAGVSPKADMQRRQTVLPDLLHQVQTTADGVAQSQRTRRHGAPAAFLGAYPHERSVRACKPPTLAIPRTLLARCTLGRHDDLRPLCTSPLLRPCLQPPAELCLQKGSPAGTLPVNPLHPPSRRGYCCRAARSSHCSPS